MIIAGSDVLLRELQFGFLREAANGKYGKAIGGEGFTHALYVTKSHFRPRRRDAKYHHSPRFASHAESGIHDLPEPLRLFDVVIGGEHGHQRITARRMAHVNGGQPNRHCGIQPHRLDQHALARGCRNLHAHGGGLFRIRSRPDALSRNQRLQTRDGLLQHGVRTDYI